MPGLRVAILGTRFQDFAVERATLEPLGVELTWGDGGDRDAIAQVAGDADLVLAGSRPRFDAETLAALRCHGIVRYGVGVDSIDLDAAARQGKWVVRTSDYGTEPVAYHAVTLAVAATRRLIEADQRVKAGEWGFSSLRPLHVPSALVAGVVGFGRIGRRVATSLAALGFEVVAHDPHVDVAAHGAEHGVTGVALETLLPASDVVSLHLPGRDDDSPLLDATMLGLMKTGAVLVNTARGSLIDQEALVTGLAQGRPGFAALDVFPSEPPDVSAFDGVRDRVILTSHMAWYTEESELEMRRQAVAEAARLLQGQRPLEPVVVPADAAGHEAAGHTGS